MLLRVHSGATSWPYIQQSRHNHHHNHHQQREVDEDPSALYHLGATVVASFGADMDNAPLTMSLRDGYGGPMLLSLTTHKTKTKDALLCSPGPLFVASSLPHLALNPSPELSHHPQALQISRSRHDHTQRRHRIAKTHLQHWSLRPA